MPHHYVSRPNMGGRKPYGSTGPRSAHRNRSQSRPAKRGSYIDPSKFINRATATSLPVPYLATHRFMDFKFNRLLQANIDRQNYSRPSAIQDQAIPYILDGRDVIGLANTGTGKTAAFLLPIINQLCAQGNLNSVLILAPTRELAQQIYEQFRLFTLNVKLYPALLVGGVNLGRQIAQLRRRPHVIIGTPGRSLDMLKRGELKLEAVQTLVLDEADRMLDMGFINDIRSLVSATPASRQTLFFSATMTPSVQQLTRDFLRNPEIISVKTADTSERVDQDIVEVNSKEEKIDKLLSLLGQTEFEKVLLFGETKHGVQRLSDYLEANGFVSAAIHGNKSQSQRQRALQAFKDNEVRILVATDVAARGLDIPNVSHVINFDQPATYEDYVHRIGRTGRGEATGKALTFVERRSY